jgi:cell division protein CrgA
MARSKKKAKAAAGPPRKPGRYTAPKPKGAKRSPLWVPATMFACLGIGVAVIIGNYFELLPGGEAQTSYLFIGLGLMIGGFALSTQFR